MMRFIKYGTLVFYANMISGFQDTSPFFFFSTSEILVSSSRIATATSLSDKIVSELQKCPSDTYVIVSQPGVNLIDYWGRIQVPHLRRMINGDVKNIRSSMMVQHVAGNLELERFRHVTQDTCGARLLRIDASTGSFAINDDRRPLVIHLEFPALPAHKDRASKLNEHDSYLASILDLIPSSKYTVIYTTTPKSSEHHSKTVEQETYHLDTSFQSPLHMELKRDFDSHKPASNSTVPLQSSPLFEKYQFFSPGIFMGLLVSIIFLSILYVAISGIASLQVTYAAFNKEMGPAAQK